MNETNTETFAFDSTSIGRRVASILWRAAGLAGKGVLLGLDVSHAFMLRTRSGDRVLPPTRRIRFSPETRLRVSGLQGNWCMYCGVRLSRLNRHLDHIYPRDHGGSNEESNLQALCASCNTRKGVQTDAEYRSRYQDLLPIEPTGFPPRARIHQSRFREITRRTSQAQSTVARCQEIFRTPRQKLTSGSTTAGIIVGAAWFVAMPLLFGDGTIVGYVALFGGIIVGVTTFGGSMWRSKCTGSWDQ
jgi:hypothetical protein